MRSGATESPGRRRGVGLPPLLATLLAACAGEAAPSSGAGLALEDLPELALVEELRIGSVQDPDLGFSRVGNVDMVDPELRPVGRVDLPKGHRLVWTSGERLWTVVTDALEIPWLVRYRLQEAP